MQKLWIFEKSGNRREAKRTKCSCCNTWFLQRKNGDHRFCSNVCKNKYRTLTSSCEMKCIVCGNLFSRAKSRLPTKVICSKECRDKANTQTCKFCKSSIIDSNNKFCNANCFRLFRFAEIKRKMLSGEYIESKTLRQYLIQERGNQCQKCDLRHWQEKDIPLDVHHEDGNYMNNHPDNLKLLCKNCHALTDTYGVKNIGKGRHSRRLMYQKRKSKWGQSFNGETPSSHDGNGEFDSH